MKIFGNFANGSSHPIFWGLSDSNLLIINKILYNDNDAIDYGRSQGFCS